MVRLVKNLSVLVLIIAVSFSILSCSSSGGGNDTNSGIINGKVQGIIEASIDKKKNDATFFTTIKNFLSLSFNAVAQNGGITVNVIKNGEIIDSTVTNAEGNFTVTGAGEVILEFIMPDQSVVELSINIPTGTVTTLNVSINENTDTASVNEVQNGLRCETGIINISDDNVVINGNGTDDCIRTEGDCIVNINAIDVTLQNCERCIDAADNSLVNIEAGSIFCEGNEEAIKTEQNADVNFIADECSIVGSIDEQDLSLVDLTDCNMLDTEEGTEVGTEDGTEVGTEVGTEDGTEDGTEVGTEDGTEVGTEDGTEDGTEVGAEVGTN